MDGIEKVNAGDAVGARCTAAPSSVIERAEVFVASRVSGRGGFVQAGEDALLQIHLFDGGLDDEIDGSRAGLRGRGGDAVHAVAGFLCVEDVALDGAGVKGGDAAHAGRDALGIDVAHQDAQPAGAEPLGDGGAHDAGADDGDVA